MYLILEERRGEIVINQDGVKQHSQIIISCTLTKQVLTIFYLLQICLLLKVYIGLLIHIIVRNINILTWEVDIATTLLMNIRITNQELFMNFRFN